MLRTIALFGFAAAVAPAPAGALATYATGYGAYPGHHRNLTPFDRSWNHYNESKERARASAEWMRRHHRHFPFP